MRSRQTRQRDLFETDRALAEIPAARRMALVRLVECLLIEASAISGRPRTGVIDQSGSKDCPSSA